MSPRAENPDVQPEFAWTWERCLRARAPLALFCLAGIASCLLVLTVAGLALSFRVLVAALLLAFLGLGLLAGYLHGRRFWCDLAALSSGLDRSWQLPSLVEPTEFAEGELVYDALRAMGAAASDEVHESRRQMADYHDYIELWVHEVKAPIASAQLLADRLSGAEASQLKTDLERIGRDVEQALFFARSTSLDRDFAISEFLLAPVTRRACKDNARFLIDAGCLPAFSIPEDTTVFGDAKWVAFILSQLVVNAAKYGASEVRFSTRVTGGPAASKEGERTVELGERGELGNPGDPSSAQTLYLEIADNGMGIPAADVPRVFDRGFTGQNGRAYAAATGMGLYLCAVMCRKMGLSIEIASEEGTGTRVILGFPYDRRRLDDVASR